MWERCCTSPLMAASGGLVSSPSNNSAQKKYSAFDFELLACYLGICHFRWLLEGRPFYVLTDHKPHTFALHRMSDHWTARQQRHLFFIFEFTTDLRHVAGNDNPVADGLSRPAAAVAPAPHADRWNLWIYSQSPPCEATSLSRWRRWR